MSLNKDTVLPKSITNLLLSNLGHLQVWGVISTYSVDVLYEGLTYDQARLKAMEEIKEAGRDAKVVIVVDQYKGTPV